MLHGFCIKRFTEIVKGLRPKWNRGTMEQWNNVVEGVFYNYNVLQGPLSPTFQNSDIPFSVN